MNRESARSRRKRKKLLHGTLTNQVYELKCQLKEAEEMVIRLRERNKQLESQVMEVSRYIPPESDSRSKNGNDGGGTKSYTQSKSQPPSQTSQGQGQGQGQINQEHSSQEILLQLTQHLQQQARQQSA